MNLAKIVYLPIEHDIRELEAKSLLAVHLLKRGFHIVIGQQWELYNQISHLPPGIFLFKSHNKIHQNAMRQAKQNGFFVAALEEETLGACSYRNIEKNSTNELYDLCDYILTPGKFEKLFHQKKNKKDNIFIVGNPRADILKKKYLDIFKEKITSIKSRFGRYCLINTNFGTANAFMGNVEQMKAIAINAGVIDLKNQESLSDFDFILDWESKNLISIKELIFELAKKNLGINFIVRPHPAESIQLVKSAYKDLSNVYVLREGSHIPWTLASEILIHTSCTTGFESFLAGHNALSLVYEENWYTQSILSNKVNFIFNSNEKIKNYLNDYFSESKSALKFEPTNINELEYFVDNIGGNSAVEKIATIFEDIPYKFNSFKFTLGPVSQRQEFQKIKCTIPVEEIEKLIKDFCLIEGNKFMEMNIKLQKMADSLFFISPQL